jgi:DNA-binding transcriptional LysR family regulator
VLQIELRQWRQFLAVAEALHFGRAAAALHMTQPPLTQAIAGLERQLGLRLFDRSRRHVALTAAGEALLPGVRDLLQRAQQLPALARAATEGEVGRLRLAFVSTVGYDLLPQWVRAFRERWPRVALELIEATGDVQEALLLEGAVDAGFVLHSPGFAPPGLACLGLVSEPMVLAVPENHPLALRPRLALIDVVQEPLVLFPRRILPSVFDALFGLYHAAGGAPQVAQEAIQMQTIVNLVSAGMGVAWVPRSVHRFERPGVVYRPVDTDIGGGVPECVTSLVWSRTNPAPVLQRFLAFAQTQTADFNGARAGGPPGDGP